MYFQLGWRNIWRNPRRTLVIMTAIIVGVWSMILSSSLMRGITDQMVRNGIATLTGHIQIHHQGYRNDPALENRITDPDKVETALHKCLPPGARWTTRVCVNAVASNARHSKGVTLVGIAPISEECVSFIAQAVTEGNYLKTDDPNGIVVGKALVEKYKTRLGHKLILMSTDTQGQIASRSFRITGIFQAEMEATEKQFMFINLQTAQKMLKLKNDLSEVCLILANHEDVSQVAGTLKAVLPATDYEVHTWQELLPLTTGMLKMYDGFILLWYVVAFVAMGFGIVNTTLMAVLERIREFGLLRALGMKPRGIVQEVLTESFFLLIIGMALGNALGLLSVFALSFTGIDLSGLAAGLEFVGASRVIYPVFMFKDAVLANLLVFVLGLLVSAYPAVKAARFSPVKAMGHT